MSDTTLVLRRTFAAPRERIFEAWTTAAGLGSWYALTDDWQTLHVEVDLRVGGRFRIDWAVGDRRFGEEGEYLEVDPPNRVVYTVTLVGTDEADVERTVCAVDFVALDDGRTEVVIVEDGYPDKASRDLHASGWPRFLDRLDRLTAS